MRALSIVVIGLIGLIAMSCSSSSRIDLGPTPPNVTVEAHWNYYDVNATSLSEIRRAIAAEGPRSGGRTWGAVTSAALSWRWEYYRGNLGCELRDVRVRVRTTITYPRWNPTGEPDSAVVAWWSQYNAGLAEHERGHAQLAVKAGAEIVKALDGMSGGNCDALSIRAGEVTRRINTAMRQQQVDYDLTTQHGGTQIRQAMRLHNP